MSCIGAQLRRQSRVASSLAFIQLLQQPQLQQQRFVAAAAANSFSLACCLLTAAPYGPIRRAVAAIAGAMRLINVSLSPAAVTRVVYFLVTTHMDELM